MMRVFFDTKVVTDNPQQSYNCKWCGKQELRGVVYNYNIMKSGWSHMAFFTFCSAECRELGMMNIDLDNLAPLTSLDPLNLEGSIKERFMKNE